MVIVFSERDMTSLTDARLKYGERTHKSYRYKITDKIAPPILNIDITGWQVVIESKINICVNICT